MSHRLNHDPMRCCAGKARHRTEAHAQKALARTIEQTEDLANAPAGQIGGGRSC